MSSPASQFESIKTLAVLYGPTLTSIHGYWKNHSFDYMDLCQHSDVSTFQYAVYVGHSFSSKEQASFNFMAVVTIQVILEPKKVNFSPFPHCFHFFPHLFSKKWWDQMPWSSFIEWWVLSQLFQSPLSPSSRGSLVPFHFLPLGWCHRTEKKKYLSLRNKHRRNSWASGLDNFLCILAFSVSKQQQSYWPSSKVVVAVIVKQLSTNKLVPCWGKWLIECNNEKAL